MCRYPEGSEVKCRYDADADPPKCVQSEKFSVECENETLFRKTCDEFKPYPVPYDGTYFDFGDPLQLLENEGKDCTSFEYVLIGHSNARQLMPFLNMVRVCLGGLENCNSASFNARPCSTFTNLPDARAYINQYIKGMPCTVTITGQQCDVDGSFDAGFVFTIKDGVCTGAPAPENFCQFGDRCDEALIGQSPALCNLPNGSIKSKVCCKESYAKYIPTTMVGGAIMVNFLMGLVPRWREGIKCD